MTLPEASFDGIGAFYSMTHIPAGEQGGLLEHVAAWLRPGGVFVESFGAGPAADWQGKWLGTGMYFSHNDEAKTLSLLQRAGLHVTRAETVKQDNEEARFLWIVARLPL